MLKTDLRYLGPYADRDRDQRQALAAHHQALAEIIGLDQGTLAVSTGSMSLRNTDTVYDPQNTPSERGALTEFIRRQPGAVRSLRPFCSYAAVGRHARRICTNTARHAYGPETPRTACSSSTPSTSVWARTPASPSTWCTTWRR